MAKTAEEKDAIVRRCLRLRQGVDKIWKHTHFGKGRIGAIRYGIP
jgi:hypothetical protein